jgi:hypothetical protein
VPEDRALARELDRALAGEDAGAEARELARLLVAAAEPARFEVEPAQTERALAAVTAPRRRSPRPRIALALAAAVVLAAIAVATLRTPGIDVQARAARALDHTFYVVETARPAKRGLFVPTVTAGTIAPARGLGHWTVSAGGELVAETAIDGSRVTRFDAASNTITIAESCAAFANGCSEVLDPIDLYRRTLASGSSRAEKVPGGWRLTVHGANAGVEQVVTIDGKTYLPRRIDWLDHGRLVSRVRISTLFEVGASEEGFALEPHPGARVRHLTAQGTPIRMLSERRIAPPHGALWLGPTHNGYRARALSVRFNAGTAVRIDYGPLTVWNYDRFVPPDVSAGTVGGSKTIEVPGVGVARIFFSPAGALVAEVEKRRGTAAIVSPVAGKVDIVQAVQELHRVR